MTPEQSQSLTDRNKLGEQQSALETTAGLCSIFDLCRRQEWETARRSIAEAKDNFAACYDRMDTNLKRILLYLDGMCKQALGEFEDALALYQSPLLSFEPNTKFHTAEKDIRVLATLNAIVAMRGVDADNDAKTENLQEAVEEYCRNHRNKAFAGAYFMVKATEREGKNTIIRTKHFMQQVSEKCFCGHFTDVKLTSFLPQAVWSSKAAGNDQLTYVVMNAMTDGFFRGIVGDQAENAVKASRTLAKKSGDRLWLCVADGMFAQVKTLCGKPAESDAAFNEAHSLWPGLPDRMKEMLTASETGDRH